MKYVKGEENLSLSILKGLLLKGFEETRLMAIPFTCDLDCEQSQIFLCQVTARETQARERERRNREKKK